MAKPENIWVGIEVTRQVRVVNGEIEPAGKLAVGGVNLLDHQLSIARGLTVADQICVLTPQGDETLLEITAKHEAREMAPFDFIAMLSERAGAGQEGAVVLLRQIAPLRDASDVQTALAMLDSHPVIISAAKTARGQDARKADTDDRCLAFEVRRISQFSREAMATAPTTEEKLVYLEANSYAEYIRPSDAAKVEETMKAWQK
ncbi:MAG: hypothetical protein IPK87_03575 [Planctomycetes bacterium]|nr:hypothetical protein [Planctomycetota bacterium]